MILTEDSRDEVSSVHWLMTHAAGEPLDEEECYQLDLAEDAERWENYIQTGEAIAHDDMKNWLQSLLV